MVQFVVLSYGQFVVEVQVCAEEGEDGEEGEHNSAAKDEALRNAVCPQMDIENIATPDANTTISQEPNETVETMDVETGCNPDQKEYLRLQKEKVILLKELPVASKRSKDEKAALHKIYHRMWKISKRTDVRDLLKTNCTSATILEKEKEEYVELLQEKKRLLEEYPAACQRTTDQKAMLYQIYNRMRKISKRTDVGHLLKRKVCRGKEMLKPGCRTNLEIKRYRIASYK